MEGAGRLIAIGRPTAPRAPPARRSRTRSVAGSGRRVRGRDPRARLPPRRSRWRFPPGWARCPIPDPSSLGHLGAPGRRGPGRGRGDGRAEDGWRRRIGTGGPGACRRLDFPTLFLPMSTVRGAKSIRACPKALKRSGSSRRNLIAPAPTSRARHDPSGPGRMTSRASHAHPSTLRGEGRTWSGRCTFQPSRLPAVARGSSRAGGWRAGEPPRRRRPGRSHRRLVAASCPGLVGGHGIGLVLRHPGRPARLNTMG